MVSRVDWKSKVFGKYWGRTLLSKNRTSHLDMDMRKILALFLSLVKNISSNKTFP